MLNGDGSCAHADPVNLTDFTWRYLALADNYCYWAASLVPEITVILFTS